MTKPKLNISLQGEAIATIAGRCDLIIGTLPFGDTNAGKTIPNVQTMSASELDAMFGARSDLRNKIARFLKTNKRYSRLDVQTLEQDTSAVVADGEITFAGTAATEDGELEITVVDEEFKATIEVEEDDTPTDIALKVKNAFAASVFSNIPVTSDSSLGVASFDAVDAGTLGNYYGLKVSGSVAGITYTITAFTNGATDPAYTSSDFPSRRYTGVAIPRFLYTSIDVFSGVLDARFNVDNKIMDGVGFIGYDESYSNIVSNLTDKNSKSIVYMGNKLVPSPHPVPFTAQSGASIMTPADWRVCEFLGIRSLRMTPDAPISDYVYASNLDNFGGAELASLPYFNTPMTSVSTTEAVLLFDEEEKTGLETIGYAVVDVNSAENAMLLGGVATSYKTDGLGNTDLTWKYLNYVDTGSICREYIFNNMKIDLAQMRLTEGDLIPDRNIQNTGSIEALFMKYYGELADAVLVQGGASVTSLVAKGLVVALDLATRTVTLTAKIPIVTQIGTVNMTITQKFTV